MATLLERPEQEKTREWMTTWEEQGLVRGLVKGREEGLLAGQRRALAVILRKRFPNVPATVLDAVERIESSDRLEALQNEAFEVGSWEALGL